MTRLSRHGRSARPVRYVHLGLGAFHRAHQAWYTERAGDDWGIAAYTGRRPDAARRLADQGGLYALLTRDPAGDRAEVISAISRAHDGADPQWIRDLRDPGVTVLTCTITEKGHRLGLDGRLDVDDPEVAADVETLRDGVASTGPLITAPGRIAAGLLARVERDAGPISVLSCDNLQANGSSLRSAVLGLLDVAAPRAGARVAELTAFVSTVVDRITPAARAEDRVTIEQLLDLRDDTPVVTEPFSEWVIEDAFAASHPPWERWGARVVPEVAVYEQRKLWLLNSAHSLLAYAGSIRGHVTVADAIADDELAALVRSLWSGAVAEIDLPGTELDEYQEALLIRFGNGHIEHRLSQIATDGSHKLRMRVPPVLRLRRQRGLAATDGQVAVLASWLAHLRGHGAPVADPAAEPWRGELVGAIRPAAARMMRELAPDLAEDAELLTAVADRCREFEQDAT
ncbi:MAG: mannitol dehydrogenase family protein [Actinobacteria bacterium]|nr:mannitol dehydrogenase family protein [Actinomycetota bacterium]